MRPVVGFDLDMTLLDTRPGIAAAMTTLAAESGVAIDVDLVLGRLGPKLEVELADWFPRDQVDAMADRYRAIYHHTCVDGGTLLLPGAQASIDAVRAHGGTVLIVTAKSEPLSRRCLGEVAIEFDAIAGHAHGIEKRDALCAHDADVYVGDTIADIEAGAGAGVATVGVATGMHTARQLTDAGATIVFESLEPFPAWLSMRH